MVIQLYGSNFDGNEDESFPSVVCISWVIALALVSFYVMVYLNIVTAGTGTGTEGRFTLRWRRPVVGQECLAKTWLYEANGGCAGEELKAIKYFY